MKKLIFILFGIIICACATTKKKKEKPKLPPIVACAEDAKIYDVDNKFEVNKLTNLTDLSYATTYTRIQTQTDSLERNEIRYQLGKTSERVALKVFPTIQLTDASFLLDKTYNDIVKNAIRIRRNNFKVDNIKNLIIPSKDTNKQLLVVLRSGMKDGQFVNSFHIYVFDSENNKLLYYDYIRNKCDPRDEIMFMKTLYYGLNKLKKSIE